ncbi:MAG: LOW QUALITY PROTEIN: hypothetical protein KVP17_002848 [Porospora cf. gigantea B]|uniref:uncharacterized protein n=1 Tax=Porospora cf. gigantea B TaxID=2853592 RepID=UPI003571FB3C|nr:MAG: LOW QUALITY PROTEIN: hypothetical protein KVP17_002848 [Porospora cf. gigantea B]
MIPSSTVDLYEELVRCLLPKCSLPDNTLALHSLTVQNAGSLFRGRKKRCLSQAIFQLKQSLAKRRAPHEAFGFVECLDSYCTQSGVASEVAPVVEVLNALADSADSGNDYRSRSFGLPKEVDTIIQDTIRTRSHPPRPPRREDGPPNPAASLKLDRAQPKPDIALVSTDLPSTDFDSEMPTEPMPLLPSRKSPPQWILLRDCLVVLQGVDGQYLKWCEKEQRFQGDTSVEISAPIRVLMGRMTEAGGCLRTILSLLKRPSARSSLLRLALDESVRIELDDYQKSVAALEMALFNGPSAAEGVELRALTLRSVAVSLAEPLAILQTLREVVEKSRPIVGGEIISLLISFRNTTLPLFKPLLSRLMESTSIPLLEMIRVWVTCGKLSDPHQEFFISSQPYQEDPFLFWTQYRVMPRLVPLSISMATAANVLVTGKTVAFISLFGSGHPLIADRNTVVAESSCRHQNEDYFRFNTSSPPRSKNIFDVNCVPSLLQLEKARITKLIFEGFELLPQLEFVKRTLLTAQGDFLCAVEMGFTQSFLAETESTLCRPRSLGSAFDLKNLLLDSLESTPGLAKFRRFFPLLYLSLSDGKRVWDSLEMSYHVSHPPLKCVLNSETDDALKQLFRLLFRVKFASRMLARTFSATGGRNSLEGAGVLRECQRLRSEMQHLASSLESYFVCDVIRECRMSTN